MCVCQMGSFRFSLRPFLSHSPSFLFGQIPRTRAQPAKHGLIFEWGASTGHSPSGRFIRQSKQNASSQHGKTRGSTIGMEHMLQIASSIRSRVGSGSAYTKVVTDAGFLLFEGALALST